MDQVREIALSMVFGSKNTNSKHQITNKSKIPNSQCPKHLRSSPAYGGIGFLNFVHWDLFAIWDLLF
jgi:hypothetical protein